MTANKKGFILIEITLTILLVSITCCSLLVGYRSCQKIMEQHNIQEIAVEIAENPNDSAAEELAKQHGMILEKKYVPGYMGIMQEIVFVTEGSRNKVLFNRVRYVEP